MAQRSYPWLARSRTFQPVAGICDPCVARGSFGQVVECPTQDNLLTRMAQGDAAAVDQGDFAEARSPVALHHLKCAGQPCHSHFHAARVLAEQRLQGRAGHIFDHRDVCRVVVPAPVSQVDPGRADLKGIQAAVSGLEQIDAPEAGESGFAWLPTSSACPLGQ